MKLYPISTSRLHIDEAGQFIVRLLSDVQQLDINIQSDPIVAAYWAGLGGQSEIFMKALKQIYAQKETKELAELDNKRDKCLIAIRRQIEVFEYYEIGQEKEAYDAAKVIMNNWKGLETANYEAETIGIRNLLDTWEQYRGYVNLLNLEPHLNNLRNAADIFESKFSNRSIVAAAKEVYDAIAIKKEILQQYKDMAEYVLVTAKNENSNEMYSKLLDVINNVRHYFAHVLAVRKGVNDKNNKPLANAPEGE
jgi:hypothetical protein